MIELGRGAQAVLAAGGRGSVAATFARAAYLRLPAGLVALATPEVPSGPLHVRGPVPIHRLRAGGPATVEGSRIEAGEVTLDLARATVWQGSVPTPAGLAAGCDVALELLEAVPASALFDGSFDAQVTRGVAQVECQDLAGAVATLSGLGPGLTPAGDDALAGVLLVARAWRGPAAEPVLVEVAAGARTNDIARAFLAWAARGQSTEPVHRFLTAVAGHDRITARAALRGLLRFGHSSGADLAFGLRLGLRAFVAQSS